jgi:SAM-dependent methyltransferase
MQPPISLAKTADPENQPPQPPNETDMLRGLTVKDFRRVAPNGFGDPHNAYPHAMNWFNGHLYVGTTRSNLALRGFSHVRKNLQDFLGEVWPVKIPKDMWNLDLRSEIWRYSPDANEWSKVYTSPMVMGKDGFEVPMCIGFRAIISFQGLSDSAPALYIPVWTNHQWPKPIILRSTDGLNFEVIHVSLPGDDYQLRVLRGLVPFKGRLFASPAMGPQRDAVNIAGAMVILESSDPARGDWHLACEPSFGNPNNFTLFHMAVFNDHLYAGTLNINEGYEVWKTDAEGQPPYKWKRVLTQGAYRGKLNQMALHLRPFKGHLYVGSGIQTGGYDVENNIGPAAPELIRINPDDSWDLIAGEPRITPDGLKIPLSGYQSGFGNPFAGYFWSMCEHEGWLYLGNAVWTIALRYSDKKERWPEQLSKLLTPDYMEKLLWEYGGCNLFRSRDGRRWVPVTLNGFNNCYNIGVRNMVSTPHGLFVGLANPFAPEVAIKRLAGWQYEGNPKGGLEIWLGSLPPAPAAGPDTVTAPSLSSSGSLLSRDKVEDKAGDLEKIIQGIYGGSDFRHFGFWTRGITTPQSACHNLIEEILAFLPDKRGSIVDLGCGLGATTKHLLKYFPPEAVTGVTTSRDYLAACRKKSAPVKFLHRKLPRLNLPAASFDTVLWVKGPWKLGSRPRLFRESLQLLKPGGKLLAFDVLFANPHKRRMWQNIWSCEAFVSSLDEYQEFLASAGFQDIRVLDVTAQSLEAFRRYLQGYFNLKKLASGTTADMFQDVSSYLLMEECPVSRCLLVSASKPGRAPG